MTTNNNEQPSLILYENNAGGLALRCCNTNKIVLGLEHESFHGEFGGDVEYIEENGIEDFAGNLVVHTFDPSDLYGEEVAIVKYGIIDADDSAMGNASLYYYGKEREGAL